jgi:hypothetical protein
MAIIYSYPENNNILPSDILVCTSTALINGKPKNQTKNISIADLTAYMALNSDNLNDVLSNGNTSLLSANIGQLGLFDAQAQNYGSLELSSSEFNFYNTSNVLTSTLTSDSLILYPNSYTGQLLVPNTITADRVYTFQNASGTVAFLSDIPVAVTPDLQIVLTAGNTATEDINLTGQISTTDFVATNDIYVSALGGDSIRVGRGPGSANGKSLVFGNLALDSNTTGTDNVAIGWQALLDNTTGANNLAVGIYALENNVGGGSNVAIGINSLASNLAGNRNLAIGEDTLSFNTASNNIAIGYNSLLNNTTASNNVAIGIDSLKTNTTGFNNIAFGNNTLNLNVGGANNIAIGQNALNKSTISDSIAIGNFALNANTTGLRNTAIGTSALLASATANDNVAIGWRSLLNNTTGASNTSIGSSAMQANTTGNNNVTIGNLAFSTAATSTESVAIGAQAMQNATLATDCIAIGYSALRSNNTFYNIAIGSQSMLLNTTGSNNTALGYFTLNANTTAIWNTAIGHNALRNNTTGSYNVAIGGQASGSGNTIATQNVAVGYEALFINSANLMTAVGYQSMRQNTTGAQNAAFGAQTLRDNTTGSGNTAVGWLALLLNTTGSSNTLMGRAAGSAITTGNQNVGYGANALLQCSIGSDNVGIGTYALAGSNSGSNNVGVGTNAGRDSSTTLNVTVNNSVFIGYETKANQSTDTNQIVIGYQAIGAGSNTATIGNTSITTTRLRGAVQGGSFVKDGGTSSQYLMADGSVTTGVPYKYNFSGSLTLTGTLTTTNLLTITIPANSLSDYLDLRSLMVQQSGPALAGFQIRVWHNSVNDFNTATRIANYAFGAGGADLFAQMTRKFSIQGGTLFGFSSTPSNATGEGSNSNAALSIAFDTTITNYLFVSVQLTNATDTATLRNVNITN